MTTERETWQSVADDLAGRLQHQAAAAGSADQYSQMDGAAGCWHQLPEADPDCPFCEDRRAYLRYLEKRRKTRRSRR